MQSEDWASVHAQFDANATVWQVLGYRPELATDLRTALIVTLEYLTRLIQSPGEEYQGMPRDKVNGAVLETMLHYIVALRVAYLTEPTSKGLLRDRGVLFSERRHANWFYPPLLTDKTGKKKLLDRLDRKWTFVQAYKALEDTGIVKAPAYADLTRTDAVSADYRDAFFFARSKPPIPTSVVVAGTPEQVRQIGTLWDRIRQTLRGSKTKQVLPRLWASTHVEEEEEKASGLEEASSEAEEATEAEELGAETGVEVTGTEGAETEAESIEELSMPPLEPATPPLPRKRRSKPPKPEPRVKPEEKRQEEGDWTETSNHFGQYLRVLADWEQGRKSTILSPAAMLSFFVEFYILTHSVSLETGRLPHAANLPEDSVMADAIVRSCRLAVTHSDALTTETVFLMVSYFSHRIALEMRPLTTESHPLRELAKDTEGVRSLQNTMGAVGEATERMANDLVALLRQWTTHQMVPAAVARDQWEAPRPFGFGRGDSMQQADGFRMLMERQVQKGWQPATARGLLLEHALEARASAAQLQFAEELYLPLREALPAPPSWIQERPYERDLGFYDGYWKHTRERTGRPWLDAFLDSGRASLFDRWSLVLSDPLTTELVHDTTQLLQSTLLGGATLEESRHALVAQFTDSTRELLAILSDAVLARVIVWTAGVSEGTAWRRVPYEPISRHAVESVLSFLARRWEAPELAGPEAVAHPSEHLTAWRRLCAPRLQTQPLHSSVLDLLDLLARLAKPSRGTEIVVKLEEKRPEFTPPLPTGESEDEAKRKREEQRRRALEGLRIRVKPEEAEEVRRRQAKEDEEIRELQAERRRLQKELERREEEARRKEEDRRREQEAVRRREEDARRREEVRQREEEEVRRREAEARRREDEATLRRQEEEAEARRREDEATLRRQEEEAEARRREDEAMLRRQEEKEALDIVWQQEEEQARRLEQEAADEERRREETRRQEADARRLEQEEADARRRDIEARRLEQEEADARRRDIEARQREQEGAEERRREESARRQREETEQRRREEQVRRQEEDAARKKAEAKRREEGDSRRSLEAEATRQEREQKLDEAWQREREEMQQQWEERGRSQDEQERRDHEAWLQSDEGKRRQQHLHDASEAILRLFAEGFATSDAELDAKVAQLVGHSDIQERTLALHGRGTESVALGRRLVRVMGEPLGVTRFAPPVVGAVSGQTTEQLLRVLANPWPREHKTDLESSRTLRRHFRVKRDANEGDRLVRLRGGIEVAPSLALGIRAPVTLQSLREQTANVRRSRATFTVYPNTSEKAWLEWIRTQELPTVFLSNLTPNTLATAQTVQQGPRASNAPSARLAMACVGDYLYRVTHFPAFQPSRGVVCRTLFAVDQETGHRSHQVYGTPSLSLAESLEVAFRTAIDMDSRVVCLCLDDPDLDLDVLAAQLEQGGRHTVLFAPRTPGALRTLCRQIGLVERPLPHGVPQVEDPQSPQLLEPSSNVFDNPPLSDAVSGTSTVALSDVPSSRPAVSSPRSASADKGPRVDADNVSSSSGSSSAYLSADGLPPSSASSSSGSSSAYLSADGSSPSSSVSSSSSSAYLSADGSPPSSASSSGSSSAYLSADGSSPSSSEASFRSAASSTSSESVLSTETMVSSPTAEETGMLPLAVPVDERSEGGGEAWVVVGRSGRALRISPDSFAWMAATRLLCATRFATAVSTGDKWYEESREGYLFDEVPYMYRHQNERGAYLAAGAEYFQALRPHLRSTSSFANAIRQAQVDWLGAQLQDDFRRRKEEHERSDEKPQWWNFTQVRLFLYSLLYLYVPMFRRTRRDPPAWLARTTELHKTWSADIQPPLARILLSWGVVITPSSTLESDLDNEQAGEWWTIAVCSHPLEVVLMLLVLAAYSEPETARSMWSRMQKHSCSWNTSFPGLSSLFSTLVSL